MSVVDEVQHLMARGWSGNSKQRQLLDRRVICDRRRNLTVVAGQRDPKRDSIIAREQRNERALSRAVSSCERPGGKRDGPRADSREVLRRAEVEDDCAPELRVAAAAVVQ